MAWYAFDSAIKSCEQFGLKGPIDRWGGVRQEIHEDVCRNGFNLELGSFVQFYGADNLDASLLMIPKTGFLPASDARVQGTIRAIERDLMRGGLVQRYHTGANRRRIAAARRRVSPVFFLARGRLYSFGKNERREESIRAASDV